MISFGNTTPCRTREGKVALKKLFWPHAPTKEDGKEKKLRHSSILSKL